MARKTIEIDRLRTMINTMLEQSKDELTEGRTALAGLLETALMETGNYKGFRYLQTEWDDQGLPHFGDETRRHYH